MMGSSAPVRINSVHYHWHSLFQMDTTIVPGIGRRVNDESGKEVYRLIYWKPGFYQARSVNGATVNIEGGNFIGNRHAVYLSSGDRISSQYKWLPERGFDDEPYFKTTFFEEVTEPYALMVLSFPALRVY